MSDTNISSVRVLRYASDGGYAASEWLRAFQQVEFPRTIRDGDTLRIGVQITKRRAIDVILHIERLDSLLSRIRDRLGRCRVVSLYRNPKRCARTIAGAKRPLAVLGARHAGAALRILVCEPVDGLAPR